MVVGMSQKPGRCIYCGKQRSLTKEHPLGAWLKGKLPMDVDGYTQSSRIIENDGQIYFEKILKRSGDPRRRNLRNVCLVCNGGWMRDILSKAQPLVETLMHGVPISLDYAKQSKLKNWFVLAAMTGDFVDRKEGTIPQIERNFIRATGHAPSRWRTWIGRFRRNKSKLYWHTTYSQFLRQNEPERRVSDPHEAAIPNTQTFTFVIGELFVTILRSEFPYLVRKWEFSPDNSLIEIGIRGQVPVNFPPARILCDESGEEISRAVLKYVRTS